VASKNVVVKKDVKSKVAASCDGRLMAKILMAKILMTGELNLCCLLHIGL